MLDRGDESEVHRYSKDVLLGKVEHLQVVKEIINLLHGMYSSVAGVPHLGVRQRVDLTWECGG